MKLTDFAKLRDMLPEVPPTPGWRVNEPPDELKLERLRFALVPEEGHVVAELMAGACKILAVHPLRLPTMAQVDQLREVLQQPQHYKRIGDLLSTALDTGNTRSLLAFFGVHYAAEPTKALCKQMLGKL
ncbi:hypothetical protein [EBPR siphovirus 1]|nr:hypothetical protein [EBPR siphovirus 1]